MPFAAAEYKRINKPDPADPMAVEIFRLDNGLTVYLTQNHQQPHFYAEIAVRAGAKFDPPEATGLAHYMEHLLFKGTRTFGTLDYEQEKPYLDRITELYEQHFSETDPDKRKEIYAAINAESQAAGRYAIPNELDKVYTVMGGTKINAHTGFEEIVYKVELPSNRLRPWARIEAERFMHPVFRLFQVELETVYEEKNYLLDDKTCIVRDAVLQKLFKHHPYGQHTIIGSVEHLKNPSLGRLYAFYDAYYMPNNMALFISGAIDSNEAMPVIDEYFSAWKPKKLPPPKHWKEKPLKGVERVHVNYLGEEYVLLAFRTARLKQRDGERLLLFDKLLGDERIGLIKLNLVLPQKLRSAGAETWIFNDYGIQFLWGIPKEGQTLEEVEGLLLGEIERIKNGEFSQEALADIVTNITIKEKKDLESNERRVRKMRDSFLSFVSWKYWQGYLGRLERVTKNEVIRTAKKYFRKNYVAGYRHDRQHDIPSIQKPAIAPITIDPKRQSEFMKQVLRMPTKEIEPAYIEPGRDYHVAHDARGVTYYYARNPFNDLFAFAIAVDVGTRLDNALGPAAGFLDKSGTESLSPQELKRKWYSLGSEFVMSVGEDETVIMVLGLDENFPASLVLLNEVLRKPASDEATLAEFKKIFRIQRRDMKKDPKIIMEALRHFNLYGRESGYLNMLAPDALEKMGVGELHAVIKRLLSYKHTVSYAGTRSFDEVRALVAGHMEGGDALGDPPPYQPWHTRSPLATEIYFFNKEMAQSRISIEFAGEVYNEDDIPASQLFNYYFSGGMSGVVLQELRESRALAYDAHALYRVGNRRNAPNVMRLAIATQSDKTIDAVRAALDLIDDGALTPERFAEAHDSIVNRYQIAKIGFRDVIGTVIAWERLGLSPDPRRERFQKVKTMQIDAVRGFHQKEITNRPKLISIVGDKNKIDREELQKIGNIIYIDSDDIFVD